MPTPRKYVCCCRCGDDLPAISRPGRYKFCSDVCQAAYQKDYWHGWYVRNVKSTKAVRRSALAAAGFASIERTKE